MNRPDRVQSPPVNAAAPKEIALGLLFSPDEAAAEQFLARCAAEGLEGVLVRTNYEVAIPASLAGASVRQPMDYLSPADCDAIHEAVLTWQSRFPAVRLASGVRLADWSIDDKHPPAVWAWLPALAPYVQVTLRSVRLFAAIAARDRPVAFSCLGVAGDPAWLAPLATKVLTQALPEARNWDAPLAPPRRVLPWPRIHVPKVDYRPVRRRASYLGAVAALAAHEKQARNRGIGGLAGHAVLIMRGARGVEWLESGQRGRVPLDEYSEGMPDALAAVCQERGWRLTVIHEGPKPTARNYCSLAERYPSFISELTLPAFGAIAAQLRIPAREQYEPLVARLISDKNFRKAFVFDGIDLFDQFSDYLSRSILNLSVLMSGQTEAWGKAFEALKPDVVIGGRLEAKPWINLAAARAGARTVSIKLGIGDEMTPSVLALRPDGSHEGATQPDDLAVWGEHQVEHLKARIPGFAGEIKACGRTRSDTFVVERPTLDLDRARLRLGIDPNRKVIVWGGTCRTRWGLWPGQSAGSAVLSPDSWEGCFRGLVNLAVRRNAQVVVRPHPVDDLAFIEAQIRRYGKGRAILAPGREGVTNVELLALSDVFVSSVSSMFAEAVLSGCVAVNVWLPEIGLIYEGERFDSYSHIAEPARSVKAMTGLVGRLLDDPDAYRGALDRARAALPRYFGADDGLNARRTAEWAITRASLLAERPAGDADFVRAG
jgi:hypothetical protein